MQQTFVVMTDFSDAAQAALSYTARLAALVEGRVILLHIFEDPLAVALESPLVLAAGRLRFRPQTSRAAVLAALAHEAQQLPVPAEAETAEAPLGPALHRLLAHRFPQLLVLGRAHAHAWFEHLLTLSHQAVVLKEAHVPVLLVPENWHRPELPRRAVVGADGAPLTLQPACLAVAPLLARLRLAATVVHVAAHAHGPSRAPEALEAVRQTSLFGPLDDNHVYDLRETAPVAGLLQAVQELDADLLVVMPRPHFFPGNLFHHDVTAELLRTSPVPVLVLPAVA
ncbi:universal stress protein [Hymenobacter armeniacus]|uniref:Universal stress protein n=1 Tax=Hymenobacter armeniacus TaxID=2771358 RepID=A0ABR8JT04_9BACT|nr:universal stress protein [Hymenobacter armeniacus]MBD2721064.1 universal stress protein [Hymenobacter armeniacus]